MGMCLPCLSGEAVDYDDGEDPVSISVLKKKWIKNC